MPPTHHTPWFASVENQPIHLTSKRPGWIWALLACWWSAAILGDSFLKAQTAADRLRSGLADRVADLQRRNDLTFFQDASSWDQARPDLLRQLQAMLGLDPWPEKTPLNPIDHGHFEIEQVVVERLAFQSQPGLWVTANLYRPKRVETPLPTVLYVCGHAQVKPEGISLGNKTHYQHHPLWFAQHGYVCMAIDTIQLGEIEGIHHGLYQYQRWDWVARGYTPAGVEAWNAIRAIDYLQERPEVDPQRIGITGRSGGGAYSWYAAALDPRIQVAVPVAGITDLQDHIVDRCIDGHCDCMFMNNFYGWDFGTLAAMMAPRPLLIGNTDRDPIFPIDGVERIHRSVAHLYQVLGKPENLGIHWTTGGHDDTQELQLGCFVWFEKHLKGIKDPIDGVASKAIEPKSLKVWDLAPVDQRVTNVQDWFTTPATQAIPIDAASWKAQVQLAISDRRPWASEVSEAPWTELGQWHETAGNRFTTFQWSSPNCLDGIRFDWIEPNQRSNAGRIAVILPDASLWNQLKPFFDGDGRESPGDSMSQRVSKWTGIPSDLPLAIAHPIHAGSNHIDVSMKDWISLRRSLLLSGLSLEALQIESLRKILNELKGRFGAEEIVLHAPGRGAMVALHGAWLSELKGGEIRFDQLSAGYADRFPLPAILQEGDFDQTLQAASTSGWVLRKIENPPVP
jgi:dienelactone hydrolase